MHLEIPAHLKRGGFARSRQRPWVGTKKVVRPRQLFPVEAVIVLRR